MITVFGSVGNEAFALPMVQAYPPNPNLQQVLFWDPVNQALNYTPLTSDSLGNLAVLKDLSVGEDLAVVGNGSIAGLLSVTGAISSGSSITGGVGAQAAALLPGATPRLALGGNAVVGPRITGWTAATGTATRSTFATGSVTLSVLAEHVKALIDDLTTHGLIAP